MSGVNTSFCPRNEANAREFNNANPKLKILISKYWTAYIYAGAEFGIIDFVTGSLNINILPLKTNPSNPTNNILELIILLTLSVSPTESYFEISGIITVGVNDAIINKELNILSDEPCPAKIASSFNLEIQ